MDLPVLNTQAPTKPVDDSGNLLGLQGLPFQTIQGEGPFAGLPATFVRLWGCNLQCPDCFGVSVKNRIPYLSRSVGPKVRLDQVQKGEVILTLDQDMKLVETTVKKVLRRVVSEWLQIRIEGTTYDVTPEHPFFTNRGLVLAEDLKIGDHILEARPNEIIAFKKSWDRNPMKNAKTVAKRLASTDYEKIGRKIAKTIAKKKRKGKYKHAFDILSQKDYDEMRRKISDSKKGEMNPNWKGEHPNLNLVQAKIKDGSYQSCGRCGDDESGLRLLVHHEDGNHDNDEMNNLKVWCHRCHNQHHERGYNFWNGQRRDGKELIRKHNGQRVRKIERHSGQLEVVNLSCAPYNTYLANGMWVHNCDTDYSSDFRMFSLDQLKLKIAELATPRHHTGTPLVVITGGEPFRQPIGPLVHALVLADYTVQIETNGTLFRDDLPWLSEHLHVVCSPKTPKVHDRLYPYVSAWKYPIRSGEVDEEDGLPTKILGGLRPFRPPSPKLTYVLPMDEGPVQATVNNREAAVQSAIKFGYIMQNQSHKLWGVP